MPDPKPGRRYLVSYRETHGLNIIHFAVELLEEPFRPGNGGSLDLPNTMGALKAQLKAAATDSSCTFRLAGLHLPEDELTRNWGDTDCTGEIFDNPPVEDGNTTD